MHEFEVEVEEMYLDVNYESSDAVLHGRPCRLGHTHVSMRMCE